MSINLDMPEVEVREQRLRAILSYHGTASELCAKSKDKALVHKDPGFSQCSDCAQGCSQLTAAIRGAAVVAHSPIGCINPAQGNSQNEATTRARGQDPFTVQV
ncbi:MAG: nitrogenase, partial [Gracilibacteraceae bacterium]|nr:nitrogenase [Gracilibacteraceae bacterium]